MALEMRTLFGLKLSGQMKAINNSIDSLQRIYMKAQMEMKPNDRFYPDANFTLRVSYGNVGGYSPKDAKGDPIAGVKVIKANGNSEEEVL